jgi:hypothetical protein
MEYKQVNKLAQEQNNLRLNIQELTTRKVVYTHGIFTHGSFPWVLPMAYP